MIEPFGSVPLVVDTSAWGRQHEPAVSARWRLTAESDLLASCPVAALEILAWTRNEDEFIEISRGLAKLPQAPVTATVCAAALGAMTDLRGSRRIPAADYLIAAAAAERGFGVLHEDRHFALLATVLSFPSVRLSAG